MGENGRLLKAGMVYNIDPNHLKFDERNRVVDDKHIAKLKNAIHENNLLHIEPIKINSKYEIIDGQHRTKAALELGLKYIPCLVVSATVHDAQVLNQHAKNWSCKDFAHYWAKQGKKEYREYLDFIAITNVPPSVAIEMLSSYGGRHMGNFKKGIFKIRNIDFVYRFMDKLEHFKDIISVYRERCFLRALWKIYNHPLYQHDRMVHKAKLVGIKRNSSMEDYIYQLQEIYNWKVRTEEKVRFLE